MIPDDRDAGAETAPMARRPIRPSSVGDAENAEQQHDAGKSQAVAASRRKSGVAKIGDDLRR